jgi:hypothetical protein
MPAGGHQRLSDTQHTSSTDPNSTGDFVVICGSLLTEAGNRLSNACTVGRVGFGAIGDVPLLDVFGSSADLAGGIIEQSLALSGVHLPKEVTRLLIVVVVDAMVPVGRRAVDRQRWLVELRLVGPLAAAIGEIGRRSPQIAVRTHRPIAVIAGVLLPTTSQLPSSV